MTSTYASLKLITGEEVVTEITSTISNESGAVVSYETRRPHILQFQQLGGGKLGLAFVPWALSNPDIVNVSIPASAVVVKFEPAASVEKQYIQQTSSIAIASHI